jgi:hypothetical protein
VPTHKAGAPHRANIDNSGLLYRPPPVACPPAHISKTFGDYYDPGIPITQGIFLLRVTEEDG